MSKSDSEIEEMVETAMEHRPWSDFVKSIHEQWEEKRSLSPGQVSKLEEIVEEIEERGR